MNQRKHKARGGQKPALSRRRNPLPWIVAGVVVVASALLVVVALHRAPEPAALAPEIAGTNTPAAPMPIPTERLTGRWVRPDGGYVIEIRGALTDGRLEARYFNPRAINVSRATWHREGAGLHVFVELRDANYPGATYKLRYARDTDRLAGEYFQPIYGQTFEVEFVRSAR